MSVLIFSLEFIYISCTTYSPYLFWGAWPSQQAMLGESPTILYVVLGECSDHWARLRSQSCLGTHPLVPTLWSRTALTTEHVYIPNHARGLVDQFLRCAQGLCRPPSMLTFLTAFRDSSITPYAVLGDCSDHSSIIAWGLLFSVTYNLDSYTTERQV